MTTQELEQEHKAAVDHALALRSRNVDADTLRQAVEKAQALKRRLDQARSDESMMAEINRLTSGMSTPSNGGRGGGLSLGQQFIDSEAGQYVIRNRGKLPAGAPWTSPSAEIMATTLDSTTSSGGDLIITDYQPGIVPLPTRPLRVADLLSSGPTDSNAVAYMKETTFTNAAAPVAEGTPKPESTIVFDAVSDPVRKIAHWIPCTEEMFEDAAALRTYLDARMRLGVDLALDDQLLNGSGTAPAIEGLLARSGLTTAVTRTGSETNADAILDQIVAIETATNVPPTGLIINPANWRTIIKTKDGDGRYFGNGPFASPGRPTLWGLPVAVTTAIVANTALVVTRSAAIVFYKGQLRVESSNAHSDFFIRNLVAVRSERRAALALVRPSSFGKVLSLT